MLRLFKAFAWMRWRLLMNSIERTGARDVVERLSLAVEHLGSIVAFALLIPSAIGLAGMAIFAGYSLATGGAHPITLTVLAVLLTSATLLSVVGPIMLAGPDRTNVVRLLLLPIPRSALYLTHVTGTLTEPWILLTWPVLLALPLGLLFGGAPIAAVVALMAGLMLGLTLMGLSSLSTQLLHLLVRNRRRGELVALLFILVLPMVGILPGMFDDDRPAGRSRRAAAPREERQPGPIEEVAGRVFALLPSQLYSRTLRTAVSPTGAPHASSLLTLALFVGAVHGMGLLAFGRLLDLPASSGPRQAATRGPSRRFRMPGLSTATSAVALAHVRLATRTPRGRSILLSPLIVFVMFALLMRKGGGDIDLGFINVAGGMALASFGSFVCLLAILPLAMNQFAIDGAGLTLELLLPLDASELLIGKAIGNGMIAGAPALLCIIGGFLIYPGGHPALWLSLPLILISIYVVAAPVAATLSAAFPRTVNLNSIGRGSNAHAMAGLLGMLAILVAAIPPALMALAASAVGRPALAPVLLLVWTAIAAVIGRALFVPARRVFLSRRENLGMVV